MSLPTALPAYDLPPTTAATLTADISGASAGWQLDRGRAVLLIHDLQHYFLRPFAADEAPLADLMANTLALRERCTEAGVPVLFSLQPGGQHVDDRGLLADLWGAGPSADDGDVGVPGALAPRPGDARITKHRYSAFFGTLLDETLTELGRDQLIICGVYAHIGVLATTLSAFMHDIQAFVVADAVADFSREHHEMALRYIGQRCGAVRSTEQIRAALASTGQPALTSSSA
ncbi:bifunctional isochorismate lyase/aryl carrier protein [Nonomuraea thailandensis]|uniref:Bifunctional isochorismate lyase/aryl carrier protein n=1 Tax=Nonomuraea thailandensis TaxID=1188745 RepID=A0A9X2GD13_9ACTN|nr:isochorismatase family protein [Nonomuraea thailandensis]MCP2353041.1 bifunctional isochorismate lyase/aryl carrier protein [Nonomuraea thailandensis]